MDLLPRIPVIIINGKGGCGKDSLIDGLYIHGWWACTVDSVAKVKEAAKVLGWDGITKEDPDRKFLHELKCLSTDYNDGPNKYVCREISGIMEWALPEYIGWRQQRDKLPSFQPAIPESWIVKVIEHTNDGKTFWPEYFCDHGAIFIHCREPENIAALKEMLDETLKGPMISNYALIKTVLVRRKDTDEHVYGNHCDDDVEDYAYDYYLDNNGTVAEGIEALMQILQAIKKG